MKKNLLILGVTLAAIGVVLLIYSSSNHVTSTPNNQKYQQSEVVNTLPDAQKPTVIELDNGAEYDMVASFVKKEINGKEVKMLAYNGSVPAPILKIPQGAEITINFTNKTDVETTVHSHGIRLDNQFDGVPDMTQKPIGVGESFSYKIKLPDAGIYWYHPHMREDYAQEMGLYGNYWVVASNDDYWAPANRELPIFLDDILLNENGIANFDKSTTDHALMGRFGNTMLINGENNYNLNVKRGEVVRLFLTNAANTRTFNFSIPGAQMKLVGGDNGKYEKEVFVENVVIAPSERSVLDVYFSKAGSYNLMHSTPKNKYMLGVINVSEEPAKQQFGNDFMSLRINNDVISDIDSFRKDFDRPADKNLKLSLTMKSAMGGGEGQHMMHGGNMMNNSMMAMNDADPIEWEDDMAMMNQNSTTESLEWNLVDEDTGKKDMDIDWKFKVGDRVKIKIFNDPKSMHPMQHPFHIHGQRFLVLNQDGKKNENMVWKDTVLIPKGSTMEILVEMSNPGEWMAHCHIAEHLEAGMMLGFTVKP